MKCRDCENLIWSYDEGERIWQCRERYCPDLDIDRECPDFALKKPDIFTTLSTLQAENLDLQAQKVRWFQIHKTQEKQIDNLEAENEKLRAELEQLRPARGAVKEEKMKEDHKTLTPEQQEMALYERAVDTFGASAQILQAVEEMSELTKALLKYIRFRNFGQGVREDLLADINEERADVSIMLNQLEVIFGDNSADERLKLQHLQQLLEAYQEGGANADHHH